MSDSEQKAVPEVSAAPEEIAGPELKAAPAPKAVPKGHPGPCEKCSSMRWRPQPRSFLDLMLARQSFRCGYCAAWQSRIVLDWTLPFPLLVLAFVVTVASWNLVLPTLGLHGKVSPVVPVADPIAPPPPSFASPPASSPASPAATGSLPTAKPKGGDAQATLNNADIVNLWQNHADITAIVQAIRASKSNYDLSSTGLIYLLEVGVDRRVILAMVSMSGYREKTAQPSASR